MYAFSQKAESKDLIVTVSLKTSRCGARLTKLTATTHSSCWLAQARVSGGRRWARDTTMTVQHRRVKTAPSRLSSLTLWRPLLSYGYSY